MSIRPSRSRRVAREMAFQALYMIEVGGSSGREAMATVLDRQALEPIAHNFLEDTLRGVLDNLDQIDDLISGRLSERWTIDRLMISDLTALRVGVFELYFRIGIPPKVSISESLELAKKYGSKESGAFVNGVLGQILLSSPKANWTPDMEEVLEDDHEVLALEEDVDEEEETVEEGSQQHEELMRKVGPWVIRTED